MRGAVLLAALLLATSVHASCPIGGAPSEDETTGKLVIYTYDSLFQYPEPYDFIGAFATFAGIDVNDVDLFCFNDAGTLLAEATSAVLNDSRRHPDVVIGLDNVLQLDSLEGLLIDYESPNQVQIHPWLMEMLDIDGAVPLIPYDYCAITLVVDFKGLRSLGVPNHVLNVLNSTSFTLQDMVLYGPELLGHMVTQHPSTSGTGLAFLLWTIATFGDPALNIVGAMGPGYDWRIFWKNVMKYESEITPSWGESFDLFVAGNYSIISSYLTDGAYDLYAHNDSSKKPILSHHNGSSYAWLNIEGLGITADAAADPDRFALAKKFVDWFLDVDIQSKIPTYQWCYPANKNVALPDFYYEAGAVVPNLTYTNTFLTNEQIRAHLDDWIEIAHTIVDEDVIPPTPTPTGAAGGIQATVIAGAIAAIAGIVAARA